MTNDEALKIILSDIKEAKKVKRDIDEKIDTWISEYNGEPYGNERDGFSKIVVKDIKKAVEWFIPNAVEPFVKTPRIVKLDGITAEDVESAKMHERLINYQFVRKFDRYSFIHDMFKVSSTEGTVNIHCGWDLEEDERVETFEAIGEPELLAIVDSGVDYEILEEYDDGTFDVKVTNRRVITNTPTAKIIPNEDFFPDPSATCMEEAAFCAFREEQSFSEMKSSGRFNTEDLDNIQYEIENSDSYLKHQRHERAEGRGTDRRYNSDAKANKKVTVYKYWGFLDMDGDGIVEPIMATIVEDKLLEIVENPYPDKELPFVSIPFSKTPFELWGEPLAEFLSDNQKVRSSIMRGIIDNMARSNNGFKFIRKGGLDPTNKRRLESGLGGVIETNGEFEITDGSYNQIPASVFNMFEIVQRESEGLSGINRTMQGTDSRGINDSATGAAIQQDMGQKRMMDVIRRHADGMKKVFRKWISYNKEFLTDAEVMRINGEYIPFKRDDISGEFDIDITVGTDGVAEAKVNQMTMLMQQVGGLSGVATIPPQFFNMMLARISDEWGYPDIAQALESAQPSPPSEEQMAAAQLEIEKLQAEVEQLKSKTQLNTAKAIEAGSSANQKNLDNSMKARGVVNPKG